MKSRSTFAKFVLLSLIGVACAMLSLTIVEGSASALVKRPDPAKMVKNEAIYGTNRRSILVPVAALVDGADLTSVAVWRCPYPLIFDAVSFVSTTTAANPASGDGGTTGLLVALPDGGLGAAATVATQVAFGPANTWKPGALNARSCFAGDLIKFGITNLGAAIDSPAGYLQIDYHLQDVFAYTPDGGAI